ncbi:hypothetical protein ACFS7Z_24395 [Pontibacter toksunensis]|uniref:Acid stress chaperone HdeA n=1 Tax=Pontibacter toksunensis TaxID=1332631 RepID=A0ABW6C1E2_9BACT
MKFNLLRITLVTAVAASLGSCQTQAGNDHETATATLLWTGEVAADGCGFEVMIDGKKYLPANEAAIDDAFKSSDSTRVQLEFVRLQEQIDRRCGMLPQPRIMDAVRVISITPL